MNPPVLKFSVSAERVFLKLSLNEKRYLLRLAAQLPQKVAEKKVTLLDNTRIQSSYRYENKRLVVEFSLDPQKSIPTITFLRFKLFSIVSMTETSS